MKLSIGFTRGLKTLTFTISNPANLKVHPANLKDTKDNLTRASDLKNRCEHKVLQGVQFDKNLRSWRVPSVAKMTVRDQMCSFDKLFHTIVGLGKGTLRQSTTT